ncbi:hypothetical protein L345_05386, partial [Ophiophagus hannah]
MEESGSTRKLVGQPHSTCYECTTISEVSQSIHSSQSQRPESEHPAMESSLLPQGPIGENPNGERVQYSARGEPAIHISAPTQDTTLATCQYIAGLLGRITEQQDGIMRELRAMRREMRLMKGEQRRTNARVISLAQELVAFKE